MINYIVKHTGISEKSIRNTVKLLDDDCTIPFIARYRKELSGNLSEVKIEEIAKGKLQFEELSKRKIYILVKLDELGVLNDALRTKIDLTADLVQLEDIYLPFKKKRLTKAEKARKLGLEPLAKMIMSQRLDNFSGVVGRFVKGEINNGELALEGARFIMAEWINERTDVRSLLRRELERNAQVESKVVKKFEEGEKAQKFRDYFNWSESLKRCPSHRLLAILRAESLGFIRVKIVIDNKFVLKKIEDRIIRSNSVCAVEIEKAIVDSYKRLLLPSLSSEILTKAKELADTSAISVFAKNLRQLLLAAPLGEKRILAIDPGFRSGCKLVCLDAQGNLEYNETMYPHPPQKNISGSLKKLTSLVNAYKIDAIAIGNGTASRETEALVKRAHFDRDVAVFVVNESGASIYSASKIARDEFPNYDITVRGAVSIGRRLADPLAELVKIEAKSIGVGQYQHDVNQSKLKSELDLVVGSCVNSVGVNVNTASGSLLKYVSGIGETLANNIVNHRKEHGSFRVKNDLKKVKRFGEKAFEQSAGFIRIKSGMNVLDDTGIHPECYSIVRKVAKDCSISVNELIKNEELVKGISWNSYVTGTIGMYTLDDIKRELLKQGLDPREVVKVFAFDQNVKTIEDIREGMLLPGIINNITNFGCFVDIGIKESGLIHISNLSDGFVKDVNEHVSLNDQVIVKVLEVDASRKRIQLALHKG